MNCAETPTGSLAELAIEKLLAANTQEQEELRADLEDPDFRKEAHQEDLVATQVRLTELHREKELLRAAKAASAWNILYLLHTFNVNLTEREETTLTIVGLLE